MINLKRCCVWVCVCIARYFASGAVSFTTHGVHHGWLAAGDKIDRFVSSPLQDRKTFKVLWTFSTQLFPSDALRLLP